MDAHGRLLNHQPAYEKLIHNEVQLQLGDKVQRVKVIKRSLGPYGVTIVTYDNNPSLKSIVYDVEFPDGTIREYGAIVIDKNIQTQLDEDGYSLSFLEGIVDYKKRPYNGTL